MRCWAAVKSKTLMQRSARMDAKALGWKFRALAEGGAEG